MLKVMPVGTCRIVRPCKILAQCGRIRNMRARSFGFLHSAAEAVQQVEYQLGVRDKPADDHLPLIATDPVAELLNVPPVDPDVVILEISSRKVIRDGELIAQASLRQKRDPSFGEAFLQSDDEIRADLNRIADVVGDR